MKVDGYETAYTYDACRHASDRFGSRRKDDDDDAASAASSRGNTSRSGASPDDATHRSSGSARPLSRGRRLSSLNHVSIATNCDIDVSVGGSANVWFSVGDLVECRDADGEWERGVVEALEDDEGVSKPRVKKEGYETAYTWEQVRPLPRTNQFHQGSSFRSAGSSTSSSVSSAGFGADVLPKSWADDASARSGKRGANGCIGASKRTLLPPTAEAPHQRSVAAVALSHDTNTEEEAKEEDSTVEGLPAVPQASGKAPNASLAMASLSGVIGSEAGDANDVISDEDPAQEILRRMRLFAREQGLKVVELFELFDKDKSGTIEIREFRAAMMLMGIEDATLVDAKRIIASIDGDGDGKLNYPELLKALKDNLARDEDRAAVPKDEESLREEEEEEEECNDEEEREDEKEGKDDEEFEDEEDEEDQEEKEVEEEDSEENEEDNEEEAASIFEESDSESVKAIATKRFEVGARVEALFEGGDEWFRGKIVQVHDEGTYDIDYDDGDEEAQVGVDLIRAEQEISASDGDAAVSQEDREVEGMDEEEEEKDQKDDESSTVVSELTEVEVPKPLSVLVATAPKRRSCAETYTFGETLGEGAFSVVKKATRNADGKVFAVKCIQRSKLSKAETDNLRREIDIMRELNHPHVIGLVEVFEDEANEIFLVQEYVAGGALFDRLQDKTVYSEAQARVVVHLLLSTLAHLHAHHVVHRDLKVSFSISRAALFACSFGSHVRTCS